MSYWYYNTYEACGAKLLCFALCVPLIWQANAKLEQAGAPIEQLEEAAEESDDDGGHSNGGLWRSAAVPLGGAALFCMVCFACFGLCRCSCCRHSRLACAKRRGRRRSGVQMAWGRAHVDGSSLGGLAKPKATLVCTARRSATRGFGAFCAVHRLVWQRRQRRRST